MPKKQKKTPRKATNKPCTALMIIGRPTRARQIQMSRLRRLFVREFEINFGNITATCQAVGIDRKTYYRWMKSNSRINRKFQAALAAAKPDDRLFDAAEMVVSHHLIVEKSLNAAALVLRSAKARKRGFHEQPDTTPVDQDLEELKKLRMLIETRAEQKGVSFAEELQNTIANYRHFFKPELIEKLVSEANN